MCLVIKNRKETKGHIAKWDIGAWKVLEKTDGVFYTAIMKVPVSGVPSEIVADLEPEIDYSRSNLTYRLGRGAVHAYADTRGARDRIRNSWTFPKVDDNVCVARGVIPKGTRYWFGESGDIAAERMRLVELVASNRRDEGLPTIAEWCESQGF